MDSLADLGLRPEHVKLGLDLCLDTGSVVVDNKGRYALSRLDYAERSIARNVRRLQSAKLRPLTVAADAWGDRTPHPAQARAVQLVLDNAVTVMTGGPGTGKTQTTLAILRTLEANGLRYACCAFSGKAARRMTELTGRPAATIHRTLGFNPRMGFQYGLDEPLPVDVVVLDEASMLEVGLGSSLLCAVATGARFVVVGDVDQLPAIGAGNFLFDLLASGAVASERLIHIFRQASESRIPWFARDVNEGRVPDLTTTGSDVTFVSVAHANGQCEIPPGGDTCHTCDTIVGYVVGYVARGIPESKGIPSKDIQVLAAQRTGALGTEALNNALQAALNPRSHAEGDVFIGGKYSARTGDRVIHTRNNYNLGVFNGELGTVIVADPEGIDPDEVSLLTTTAPNDTPPAPVSDKTIDDAATHLARDARWVDVPEGLRAAVLTETATALEAADPWAYVERDEDFEPVAAAIIDEVLTRVLRDGSAGVQARSFLERESAWRAFPQAVRNATVRDLATRLIALEAVPVGDTAGALARAIREVVDCGKLAARDTDGLMGAPDGDRQHAALEQAMTPLSDGAPARSRDVRIVMVVDFGDKRIAYTKVEARELLLAYAITIHKAQGSSAKAAVFVVPEQHGYMLTRALVYTAVTRAEKMCVLIGAEGALAKAVRNRRGADRRTTLQDRLAETPIPTETGLAAVARAASTDADADADASADADADVFDGDHLPIPAQSYEIELPKL